MAATYSTSGAAGVADAGATTQDSSNITVSAGSVMYALVANSDSSPAAPSGVVWAPSGANESLTQIGTTITHGTFGKASLWRLINPTAATATVRATWGANQAERLVNVWVGTGINTTTPNGTLVQNQGASNNNVTTGAISTTAGQLVLAMLAHLSTSATAMTYDSPTGTERQDIVTSGAAYDGSESQDFTAIGTSTTLTATLGGGGTADSWAAFGIPLNDASGGASYLGPPALIANVIRNRGA